MDGPAGLIQLQVAGSQDGLAAARSETTARAPPGAADRDARRSTARTLATSASTENGLVT